MQHEFGSQCSNALNFNRLIFDPTIQANVGKFKCLANRERRAVIVGLIDETDNFGQIKLIRGETVEQDVSLDDVLLVLP